MEPLTSVEHQFGDQLVQQAVALIDQIPERQRKSDDFRRLISANKTLASII